MSAGGRFGGWPGRRGGRRRRLSRRAEAGADAASVPPPATVAVAVDRTAGPAPLPVAVRDCAREHGDRGRPVVRVAGTLRTVSARGVAGMPALTAELDDGTGTLAVVWLGRRAIAGIEPGRGLVASGRVAFTRGQPVLFNPRYELRPDDPGRQGGAP